MADFNQAFDLVVDNDRKLSAERELLIEEHWQDQGDLAYALEMWCDEAVGLEPDGDPNPLRAQILQWAVAEIDWWTMAGELIDEYKRDHPETEEEEEKD
jgi:hypothetical protein